MRTANWSGIRSRPIHQHAPTLWSCALLVGAVGCTAPAPGELAELRRDHERCLEREEERRGEVGYAEYQACMNDRGWAAADLTRSAG